MTEDKKNKNFGFRVTEDDHERIKMEAVARRVSVQELQEVAVDLLLAVCPRRPYEPPTERETEFLADALALYRSPEPQYREVAQSVTKAAAQLKKAASRPGTAQQRKRA